MVRVGFPRWVLGRAAPAAAGQRLPRAYPNMIPLPASAIRRIVPALRGLEYDRVSGAFPGLTVATDARGAVERSAARYLKAIGA